MALALDEQDIRRIECSAQWLIFDLLRDAVRELT